MTPRFPTLLSSAAVLVLTACAAPQSEVEAQTAAPELRPVTVQAPEMPPATKLTRDQRFAAWQADYTARKIAQGLDPALVRSVVGSAEINAAALDRDESQPEFTAPVWTYLDNAVKPSRLNPGRENLIAYDSVFAAVEAAYGVDREYLTAIWGLESQYGTIMGSTDVVDAVSTFAFEGRRAAFFEAQLDAVLDLLADGTVRRDQLVGSWAGAMGMTQFIPTTFQTYAVDFDRDGNLDLWSSESDALASAAHYLSRSGWTPNQPAMAEIRLPRGFNYSLADGQTARTPEGWAAMGVLPVAALPPSTTGVEAELLLPAGHRGPAFLTFPNFDVIKRYNNSTSYAMGITALAETLKGRTPVTRDFPRSDQPLSFEDKKILQAVLSKQGYSTGGIDGQIGPNTRRAIRAWQRANGVPADGYVEQDLFRRITGM